LAGSAPKVAARYARLGYNDIVDHPVEYVKQKGSAVPLPRRFLTAQWRNLAMLNYAVDPSLLSTRVPAGTELDFHDGLTYVSLVGFLFLGTRVHGIRIPFHTDFEEVNLRYYVKRIDGGYVKRGVVFIQELVPRFAIAAVARLAFGEKYIAAPMSHSIVHDREAQPERIRVDYGWRYRGASCRLSVTATGPPAFASEGSIEEFITEHYWGYAADPSGGSSEYRVAHERWRLWKACDARLEGDTTALYGADLARILMGEPDSVSLADGSAVTVSTGRRIA
jgi:uncharacterized protein YqjF (DUF2071 family)